MLLRDEKDNNRILDYNISFDDESKKMVLEILADCFCRRKFSLPVEETFLLHKDFNLTHLKWKLESGSNIAKGGFQDLAVYHYAYDKPKPKKV